MASRDEDWEKKFPLAKLILDGVKSIRGEIKEEPKEEYRPMSFEEWQLRKRREAGFMY